MIPEFYARDPHGIPTRWVARMRESMARLTPQFSTSRAIGEYTEQHYLPAAAAYRARAADQGASGKRVVEWRRALDRSWDAIHFGAVEIVTDGGRHTFAVGIDLAGLDPDAVRVQLYAGGVDGAPGVHQEMTRTPQAAAGPHGNCVYRIAIPAVRDTADYTVRVVPYHQGIAIPLEETRVAWLR